ncbi:MAG: class I SAM-dependent methyltransferase [Methylotenera sp.]|nr:class I SAM-dependent methyltransferase [Oligoflexia bacterium]
MSIPTALAGLSLGLIFLTLLAKPVSAGELKPKGTNAYQLVTGDDSEQDRTHWDALFNKTAYVFGKEPAPFLRTHIDKLPVGRALDIAMSEGRNAVYLAKKGFSVDGVDISEVALRKAKRLARENHVSINTINADLSHYTIKPESYQVIVNIQFFQRSLISQIKRGLKKGGVVVYENYTVDQLNNASGQGMRRDYVVEKGELKELFKDFEILVYKETNDGTDAVASLVARKP